MNIITVITSPKVIIYNEKSLEFDFDIPAIFPSNFFCLYWWDHEQKYEYWTKEEDGTIIKNALECSEEIFNSYVQPFIAQFKVYIPSETEIRKQITDAVQLYMDDTVSKKGYDNILSACSYSNSTDEIFRTEGQACLKWRDDVWRKCYDILAEVLAGNRAIPTEKEVIAELPKLVW